MSLFVAKQEENSLDHDPASHMDASVIYIDDRHSTVWLWVPQLHVSQCETENCDLYTWNFSPHDNTVVKFAKVDPNFRYKGLVRLLVEDQTFSTQRSWLTVREIESAGSTGTA